MDAHATREREGMRAVDCLLRDEVTRLVNEAARHQAREVTLSLQVTAGWGCPCPPLAHAALEGTAIVAESFIYPLVDPGVRDLSEVFAPGEGTEGTVLAF
jgi:hypothetical protein